MKRLFVCVAVAAIGGIAVGCGDDGRYSDAPPPAAVVGDPLTEQRPVIPTGRVEVVQALDNTFRADTLEVAPGTEVRWENVGRNDHDVKPVGGGRWGVGAEEFQPADQYSHVFSAPGEYQYFCTLHGTETAGMIGTVIVTEE
jgi:plastocyanin